jgi:hypothetical protein
MNDRVYLKRKDTGLPPLLRLVIALLTLSLMLKVPGVRAQGANGITQPVSGETIAGVVTVQGTAVHPDYLRYELAFRYVSNPTADWIVFAEGSQPVTNGTLAVWDTTVGQAIGAPVFPDGRYHLRLRVVRTDYNYDEYFATDLVVANSGPTPTSTPDPAATGEPTPVVAPPAGATAVFQQPTPLPSLTPFPTSTPPAAPENPGLGAVDGLPGSPADASAGLLAQVAAIDVGQFGRAFWQGVRLTGLLFAALALYLLLRALFRWAWRRLWRARTDRKP